MVPCRAVRKQCCTFIPFGLHWAGEQQRVGGNAAPAEMLRNTRSRTVFAFQHHFKSEVKEQSHEEQTIVRKKSLSKLPSAREINAARQLPLQKPALRCDPGQGSAQLPFREQPAPTRSKAPPPPLPSFPENWKPNSTVPLRPVSGSSTGRGVETSPSKTWPGQRRSPRELDFDVGDAASASPVPASAALSPAGSAGHALFASAMSGRLHGPGASREKVDHDVPLRIDDPTAHPALSRSMSLPHAAFNTGACHASFGIPQHLRVVEPGRTVVPIVSAGATSSTTPASSAWRTEALIVETPSSSTPSQGSPSSVPLVASVTPQHGRRAPPEPLSAAVLHLAGPAGGPAAPISPAVCVTPQRSVRSRPEALTVIGDVAGTVRSNGGTPTGGVLSVSAVPCSPSLSAQSGFAGRGIFQSSLERAVIVGDVKQVPTPTFQRIHAREEKDLLHMT